MNNNLSDTLKKHTTRLPIIKLLILTLTTFFGFTCFSNAGSYTITGSSSTSLSNINSYKVLIGLPIYGYNQNTNLGVFSLNCTITNANNVNFGYNVKGCESSTSVGTNSTTCPILNGVGTSSISDGIVLNGEYYGNIYSLQIVPNTSGVGPFSFDWSCTLSGANIGVDCPECQECQSCPEVDTNYCVENDLCPVPSNFSQIYINDIEHESAPIINIDIPEEIDRDYENNETGLNIDVMGYAYDQEKMQGIVNMQNYKPTSEEMSSLIGKIADFLPLIAIALLIIRIRRVLKKVFRF